MAHTPKTPASAVRATLTPNARVEKTNPRALGRTTTPAKAVSDKAKLPVAAAIQETVANSNAAGDSILLPDEKALNYPGLPELQPDIYPRSTESGASHKAKRQQFDLKAKDNRSSKSGQSKRGRPKMTNGRRGG